MRIRLSIIDNWLLLYADQHWYALKCSKLIEWKLLAHATGYLEQPTGADTSLTVE